jgi:hypothetical protein
MANYTDTNMLIMRMRIAYYSRLTAAFNASAAISLCRLILTFSRTTNSQIALGSAQKGAPDCSQEIGLCDSVLWP